MDAKHSILGNEKTLRETCIMSYRFPRITRQKTQKFVYMEKFLRYQNAETPK